jgi:hypothetical protein
MANKRISELTSASALTLTDLLALVNDAQTKKVTLSTLLSFIVAQEQFATLDSGGKIPLAQLPDSITGSLHYQTTWDADLNLPAIPIASATNLGWYYVVGTAGETIVNGISDWKVGDWLISNGEAWQKIDNTDAVLSWNGRMGAVMPESGDYDTDDVTEAGNKYFTEARVLAALLASLSVPSSPAAAITSSDSVLTAMGKLQGQLNDREVAANKGVAGGYPELDGSGKIPTSQLPGSVIGATIYQGTWDGTGTPGTASTSKGHYYVLSANSSTVVDGTGDWKIGDWIISNGSIWQKVDNTDAISSWNGRTGAVIPMTNDYTTSQVPEEANLYFTTARVLSTLLAGLSVPSSPVSTITSSHSVLAALGRLQGQINDREVASNKGAVNGYAGLDGTGKVPTTQLPASVLGAANYQGTWNGVLAMPPASSGNKGHYLVLSANSSAVVDGTGDWKIGDWIISNGTIWQKVDNSDAVSSFAGRSGAVTPQLGDYTTSIVAEGTNKYYTAARVLAEVLAGINTSQTTAITSSDSVLTALGKAQGQINTREFASNKGVSFGYAGLDAAGIVPRTQIPKGTRTIDLDFTGYTVSGTTNDYLYGFSIPSGTFAAGDQLNVRIWFGGTNNANAKTLRVYFNTANSLSGATLVGTYGVTSGAASAKFEREFSFITNTTTKAGVAAATSSSNGENTATADAAFTIPSVSAGFWVVIAGQKANNADTMKVERIELSGLFS